VKLTEGAPGGCEGQTGQRTVELRTTEYELVEETKTISKKVTRRKGPEGDWQSEQPFFLVCFNRSQSNTNTFELRVKGRRYR
jgi:hypothetical protein